MVCLYFFFVQEFEKAGVDMNKPMVASCARGITACTLALGAAILGKEIPVYDVSSIRVHVLRVPALPRQHATPI